MSYDELKQKFEQLAENKDFSGIATLLVSAFQSEHKNIRFINYVEQEFKDNNLYSDLIELYKIEFYYTLDPMVFEKLGDLHIKLEEYESAVSAYLDCAEMTDDYCEIYKKLADTFGLLQDEESRKTCLEKYDLMKNEN